MLSKEHESSNFLKNSYTDPRTFISGRYCITPFVNLHPQVGFTAQLSIRSGHGMASHDRVFTFSPLFRSKAAALRYALHHAHQWLGSSGKTN